MTKTETIIKHWADLNIDALLGICTNTGWYCGLFCNGIDDIIELYGDGIVDLIDLEIDHDGIGKFRPKSLRGIEDNNGWIKIEKVEDLPDYDTYLVVMRKNGSIVKQNIGRWLGETHDILEVEKCSHYKPIEEEEKPLY